MLIKCTFLVPREPSRDFSKELSDLSPLPDYIVTKGPYLNDRRGGFQQIIIILKFPEPQFAGAQDCISKRLDRFRSLPAFTLSAHIYHPRPSHLSLEKGVVA